MAKIEIEKDGPVTTIIINRPEVRNALDLEATNLLNDAFVAFERDEDAKGLDSGPLPEELEENAA